MTIRFAVQNDAEKILQHDRHISKYELEILILLKRVLVLENGEEFTGWLRWNMFWDNTPFMNMLYILPEYRKSGAGKALVNHWEQHLKQLGFKMALTSTLSNESAQHFYRKLGYSDCGALLLESEPLEIIMKKNFD